MLSGDKKKKKAKMMNFRVLLTNVVCWVTRRRQKAKPNQRISEDKQCCQSGGDMEKKNRLKGFVG
jgi:hypothetical protein